MSVHKNCLVLADGEVQFTTLATNPAKNRKDTQIPLTADGSAVRVSTAAGAFASTTTSRASSTLTGSPVTSTAVDLAGYNSASVEYRVTLAQAGQTALITAQWSNDNVNFWDEPIIITITSSGSDAAGTLAGTTPYPSKVVSLALDTLRSKGERFNREARYLRFSALAGGVTTATLAIFVTPLNN